MMKLLGTAVLGLGTILAGHAMAATVNQATGYALDSTGTTFFTVNDLTKPVPPTDGALLREGGVITAVDAITYRPNTGGIFAFKNDGNLVFSVDATNGALTRVVAASGTNDAGQTIGTTSRKIGFDFNNALDAARIVSVNDENLVFFPTPTRDPAAVIRATDLFYVPGDANENTNPSIFANAYTNAVAKADVNAATQVQYALDSNLDVLTTLNNNSGELQTLGRLVVDGVAIDFSDIGGFDILSPASDDNLGFALLNVGDNSNLYSFALPGAGNTGDVLATFVSSFGKGFSSFTVAFNGQPEQVAPVPLPAAAFLLLGGLGGLGALRRFGRRKA